MNDKQKELLESINLKTIDSMIHDRNINVLAVIKDSKEKDLFFEQFYEVMFLKMITQYQIKDFATIAVKYENFGLNSLKASELMNEGIKYIDYNEFRSHMTYTNSPHIMKSLNESNLFMDEFNMVRTDPMLNSSEDKTKLVENNEKLRHYLRLDNKLETKGTKNKPGKI